ncbi:methyltransferase [Corallococcus sp. Z5C101001]|nr:methyltransferase [Corallococcus sp. Z5C101001]
MTPMRSQAVPRPLMGLCVCLVLAGTAACRSEGAKEERREAPRAAVEVTEKDTPTPMHGVGGIEGEDPTFDQARQPARVIAALGIAPGQHIADIGAGRGYFTLRLSDAVGPEGQLVSTDVDDAVIQQLRMRVSARKNVVVRKVGPDDPGLEAGAYDLILLSEVDHFLSDRAAYLMKLRAALAPHGRIAVTHLRAMRPPLVAAAQAAGLFIASEDTSLPDHYLLILQPASSH